MPDRKLKRFSETDNGRAFAFLHLNTPKGKPHSHEVTEIRWPCYSPMGSRYVEDILETMGNYVNILKFAGDSFSLMPRKALKEVIALYHRFNVRLTPVGLLSTF